MTDFKGNDFMNNLPNAIINALDVWFLDAADKKIEYKNTPEWAAVENVRLQIEANRKMTRDNRPHDKEGDLNSQKFGDLNREVSNALAEFRKEMHKQDNRQKVYYIKNNESKIKLKKLLDQNIIFDQDVKAYLASQGKIDMDAKQKEMFLQADTMVNLAINLIKEKADLMVVAG